MPAGGPVSSSACTPSPSRASGARPGPAAECDQPRASVRPGPRSSDALWEPEFPPSAAFGAGALVACACWGCALPPSEGGLLLGRASSLTAPLLRQRTGAYSAGDSENLPPHRTPGPPLCLALGTQGPTAAPWNPLGGAPKRESAAPQSCPCGFSQRGLPGDPGNPGRVRPV